MENLFFHIEVRGCRLRRSKKLYRFSGKVHERRELYCEIHRCDVCRCGWEMGFHQGTNSRLLVNNMAVDNFSSTETKSLIKPNIKGLAQFEEADTIILDVKVVNFASAK